MIMNQYHCWRISSLSVLLVTTITIITIITVIAISTIIILIIKTSISIMISILVLVIIDLSSFYRCGRRDKQISGSSGRPLGIQGQERGASQNQQGPH